MTQPNLFQSLFSKQLYDLYSAESQLVIFLPKIINAISSNDLKSNVSNYYEGIVHHLEYLNQIYHEKQIPATTVKCKAVEGTIEEAKEYLKELAPSPVRDAALIACLQQIQHYKIALYGTARTFARHLQYEKSEQLLQRALNFEGESDRQLTRLAEGSLFSTGINEQACQDKTEG